MLFLAAVSVKSITSKKKTHVNELAGNILGKSLGKFKKAGITSPVSPNKNALKIHAQDFEPQSPFQHATCCLRLAH
jgi:hypothetical protein